MNTTRREFVERMAAGAALVGGIPLADRMEQIATAASPAVKDEWDLSWAKRVASAKSRAVFDSPEIESGLGMMRTGIWKTQVNEVQGIPLENIAAVSVLRHAGIVLAMQQAFWDRYDVGRVTKATGLDGKPTKMNPVLVTPRDGAMPPILASSRLEKFIAGGGIALACNLAFEFEIIPMVMKKDGLAHAAARKRAISMMVPGVLLQPSGVFAIVHAQEAGAQYVGLS